MDQLPLINVYVQRFYTSAHRQIMRDISMHKSSVSTVINFVADSFLIIQMLQRFAVSFKSTKPFPKGTLSMPFTHTSLGVTPVPVSSHPAPAPSTQQPQAGREQPAGERTPALCRPASWGGRSARRRAGVAPWPFPQQLFSEVKLPK